MEDLVKNNNSIVTGNNVDKNDNQEDKVMAENVETKKISIEKFIKGVNNIINLKTDENKKNEMLDEYIGQHMLDRYISYGDKVDIVNRIIRSSCYIRVGSDEENTLIFKQNSPAKHMLYCLSMIEAYTDIDILFVDSISEYDMFAKDGISMMIMNKIPQRESTEFAMLMSMIMEDIYENERSAVGLVENTKITLGKIFDVVLEQLIEIVGNNLDDNGNYVNKAET